MPSSTATPGSPVILRARGVCTVAGAPLIDVDIREGEIVGLAGLDGHGQQRFLKTLSGLYRPLQGSVRVTLPDNRTVVIDGLHKAARAGVMYLPRERKTEGMLRTLSVLDNFGIATASQDARLGFISRRAQRERLQEFQRRLSMIFSSPSAPITSLSGGNQQKVLLARWMAASPRIMLLNDPTRGVDMATKVSLYKVFQEMAQEGGTTLVLLSTELEEFIQLCHRTLVFRDGGIFAELDHAATTRAKIMAAMFGRDDEH